MDIPPGPVVLGSKPENHRVEKVVEVWHFPSARGSIIPAARGLLAPSACRAVAGGTGESYHVVYNSHGHGWEEKPKKHLRLNVTYRLLPMDAARMLEWNIISSPAVLEGDACGW